MQKADDWGLRGKDKCVYGIVCTIINGIMSIHFQHDTTNSRVIELAKQGTKASPKVLKSPPSPLHYIPY